MEYTKAEATTSHPGKENAHLTTAHLAQLAARLMDNKKARQVRILDIRKISPVTDYFVLCSGGSTNQVRAIADHVADTLGDLGIPLHHAEGYDNGRWVLLDYGDVVVHVFHAEDREFYDLDRLWGDAPEVEMAPMAVSQ